jgi:hypothetical protein
VNGVVVHPVQPRAARLAAVSVTVLAAAFVLVVLAVPSRIDQLDVGAALRLPLEPLVYLTVVLLLPSRRSGLRTGLALAAGVLLALIGVVKLLDLGFGEALNRPFDPLIDWRYAGSLAETLRGSAGTAAGTGLLVLAVALVLALLVLLPLSVLRVTRTAAGHRRDATRVVAVLAAAWLVLGVLGVRAGGHAVSSAQTSAYAYSHLARIPSELRDQRQFTRAAAEDPMRRVPPPDLLAGLRGKDVLVVFVESFGRVAVEGSSIAPAVDGVLDAQTRALAAAGYSGRSAYLTSPTFGGLSWLAHSTLQSGMWVDDEQRYDQLVASPRLTLSRLFGQAGWRTVAVVPANDRDWPERRFYGFDHVYDSRNLGYHGPRFGYPTMPDQFTLEAFRRGELRPVDRRPVMAEIDLLSSHTPWAPTPRMVPPSAIGDGSVYDGMPEQLPTAAEVWRSPEQVRSAYGASIRYSLTALGSFLTAAHDDNLVVVVLGDHQPAAVVSGEQAGHDVPVAILSRDAAVIRRLSGWGWADGLRPASAGPVWPMDAFRDRFLTAFAGSDTGVLAGGGRHG